MKFFTIKFISTYHLCVAIIICVSFSHILLGENIDDRIILHYPFDSIANDISGNNIATTLQGASSFVDHDGRGAVDLAGGSGDYVEVNNALGAALGSLTEFTIATWVYVDDNRKWARIFDFGSGSSYYMFMCPVAYTGNLRYAIKNGDSEQKLTADVSLEEGEWSHVAVTHSSSGTSLYLNGMLVANSSEISNTPSSLGVSRFTQNYLGKSQFSSDPYLDGKLSDFRIYNKALTDEDIKSISGLSHLIYEYNALDFGDLSNVNSDLDLPLTGQLYPSVSIEWSSSVKTVISDAGVVDNTITHFYDEEVLLVATLSVGDNAMKKEFIATVPAVDSKYLGGDLLVKYDFTSSNDSLVYDVTDNELHGTLNSGAKVITMGTPVTGIYNVLSLGKSKGYLNLDERVGRVFTHEANFSVSTYYRVDDTYTYITKPGNRLWMFSNTDNILMNKIGYTALDLQNVGLEVSHGYKTEETGCQKVVSNHTTPLNGWHHIVYNQQGNKSEIYIDGMLLVDAVLKQSVSEALRMNGDLGPTFNAIGKSNYFSDKHLKYTLVYDFRIYNRTLSASEITSMSDEIIGLEHAHKAYVADGKTADSSPQEEMLIVQPSYLAIYSNSGNSSVELSTITSITFDAEQMDIECVDRNYTVLSTEANKMTFQTSISALDSDVSTNSIWVSPNPTSGSITFHNLQFPCEVQLFTLSGQLVRKLTLTGNTLELGDLPSGLYLIRVNNKLTKLQKL